MAATASQTSLNTHTNIVEQQNKQIIFYWPRGSVSTQLNLIRLALVYLKRGYSEESNADVAMTVELDSFRLGAELESGGPSGNTDDISRELT